MPDAANDATSDDLPRLLRFAVGVVVYGLLYFLLLVGWDAVVEGTADFGASAIQGGVFGLLMALAEPHVGRLAARLGKSD